jgi:hypothetical protein
MSDHRPPQDNPGACALDTFLRDRRIKNAVAARRMGVSRPTVLAWRRGEKTPEGDHPERIEVFCAKVHLPSRKPIRAAGGRLASHCPRELWKPSGEGAEVPAFVVQPYDAEAEVASSPEAP